MIPENKARTERQTGMLWNLLLTRLCCCHSHDDTVEQVLLASYFVYHVPGTLHLEVQLLRWRLVTWTPWLWGRGSAGEERRPGVALGNVSALQGMAGGPESPPQHFWSISFSLPMSVLPAAVSLSPVCSLSVSQTPSHPLCAQLCPAHTSWHCPGAALCVQGLRSSSDMS